MHGFYRKSGRNADVQTKQEKVSPEGARRICSSAADLGLILCEGGAGNTVWYYQDAFVQKRAKRRRTDKNKKSQPGGSKTNMLIGSRSWIDFVRRRRR